MNPDNNVIITEDGRRLSIEGGLITGTDDPKVGLAHETGNVLDEDNRMNNESGGACPVSSGNAGADNSDASAGS